MPDDQQIIVKEAGFVFKEPLVERIDDGDVAPVGLVFIIAGVLPYFMFCDKSIW